MDTRVEAVRFLGMRLGPLTLIRLGLVRFGIIASAPVPTRGGFTFSVTGPDLHRVYDILHLLDDGWKIDEAEAGRIRLNSNSGVANVRRTDFIDAPWRAVLAASGWTFTSGYAGKDGLLFHETDDLYVLHETFDLETYKPVMSVEGKVVVDVGASFGDTAVYFSRLGAKVHAFEPVPAVYERACETIRLNGCGERVALVNAAIASESVGFVSLPRDGSVDRSSGFSLVGAGGQFRSRPEGGLRVPVTTLADAIGSLDVQLLKMDCEGAEYGVILRDYKTVRRFDEVIVEWHQSITGIPVGRLIKQLSADFVVTTSYGLPISQSASRTTRPSRSDVGILHAVKVR